MKILRIFNKSHNILDEISTYDNLKYGWTLNDVDTLEFQIALNDAKCAQENMKFLNNIEIVDEDIGKSVWGGVIAGHSFDDMNLKINCVDYNFFLKMRRLREKQYPSMQYGSLMKQMIIDCQNAEPNCPIRITIGSIDDNVLLTTRLVKNTDNLWDKIKEFGDDANYDYWVDVNRKFNFAARKGKDKPRYILEYGGPHDNIIVRPTLSTDILSMANSIYAETQNPSMHSEVKDNISIDEYGLMEGTFNPNDGVSLQNTLDIQTSGELQCKAYPVNSFSITAIDSGECPFDDIEVGDSVTVHLIPYFNFMALMRILRMQHDEKTGQRQITFGNMLLKPQPPTKRLYKR